MRDLLNKGVMEITEYILNLTENYRDQILADFEAVGVNIVWVSKVLPRIVAVETNKSKEELIRISLVKSVEENEKGYYLS